MLVWGLEWGGKVEFLKKLQEQGQAVPALDNRPTLKPWLGEPYKAFQTLSASRSIGMGGASHIPLSEIKAYLEIFEIIDIDDREDFIKMMQALDSIYLENVAKRRDSERKVQPSPSAPRRHRKK